MLLAASMLMLFAAVIVLRLLYIQLWERSRYKQMADRQYIIKLPLDAQRGLIYDRNMNLLALNEACISIGLDKSQMEGTATRYARELARVLPVSEARLRRRITSVRSHFLWLVRRIDSDYGIKIASLQLPGIRVEKDTRRRYPHQDIGSHILGFTNADNVGIEGVELSYNSTLAGRPGWKIIQRDGRGRAKPEFVIDEQEPRQGTDVVLTIDYILQTITTEELRTAARQYNARSGSIIIADPRTGDILAMANTPGYDPNAISDSPVTARKNRAITDVFEPGSTFKIATFAALMEEKHVREDTLLNCENGRYVDNGRTIRDTSPHKILSAADVMRYSSNIGTVKLAKMLSKEEMYDMVRKFGFGSRTRIGLEGETPGIVHQPRAWSSYTRSSLAIGQEISVSLLQLTMAYAAIANGGKLLKPNIVRGTVNQNGQLEEWPNAKVVRRVISESTAARLTSLLRRVVDSGTGKAARIPGISIAGKTGTAQKPREDGKGYSDSEFVASFVGFFPAENPRYLISIMLDTDRQHQWGGASAAPTFKRIAQRILIADRKQENYTGLTRKQADEAGKNEQSVAVVDRIVLPDMSSRRFETARAALLDMGLKVSADGEGEFILTQSPEPGTILTRGDEVHLQLFSVVESDGYIEMPSVVGLSLREALNRLAIENIEPVVYGSGRVKSQKPRAGTRVRAGIRSIIECDPPAFKVSSVLRAGMK